MGLVPIFVIYALLQTVIAFPSFLRIEGSESSFNGAHPVSTYSSRKSVGSAPSVQRALPTDPTPGNGISHFAYSQYVSEETPGTESPDLVIKDIKVHLKRGVTEKVLIFATTPFTPLAFALEGENPRIVIDIRKAGSAKEGLQSIPVHGDFIKQIRTHHHKKTGTFRVVLDLYPSGNYHVNHAFYDTERIYAIEIEAESERAQGMERVEESAEEERTRTEDIPGPDAPLPSCLRWEGKLVNEEELRAMLLQHNFYSACWNSNSGFCNSGGEFRNVFLDNGDGTITDQATGLMWQKEGSVTQSGLDPESGSG